MVTVDPVVQQVTLALSEDPRTADQGIEVVSQSGIVTLMGQASRPEISEAAEEVARRQPGVVSVINSIQVVPNS